MLDDALVPKRSVSIMRLGRCHTFESTGSGDRSDSLLWPVPNTQPRVNRSVSCGTAVVVMVVPCLDGSTFYSLLEVGMENVEL